MADKVPVTVEGDLSALDEYELDYLDSKKRQLENAPGISWARIIIAGKDVTIQVQPPDYAEGIDVTIGFADA